MNGHWIETTIAILGLAIITVVSRAFFMIPERELPCPTGSSAASSTHRWPHSRP